MQYAHWKAALMLEGEFPVAFALKLARKDVAARARGRRHRRHRAGARRGHREAALDARRRRSGYGEDDSAATFLVARRTA